MPRPKAEALFSGSRDRPARAPRALPGFPGSESEDLGDHAARAAAAVGLDRVEVGADERGVPLERGELGGTEGAPGALREHDQRLTGARAQLEDVAGEALHLAEVDGDELAA